MNPSKQSADELKKIIVSQLESFRLSKNLHPLELLDWLGRNINTISDTVTGRESHKLMEDSSSWYTSVRVIDDKPVLVFQTVWLYKTDASNAVQRPKLEFLAEFLPVVTVVPLGNTKEEVAVDLLFDTTCWRNLVPHVLYYKALNALNGSGPISHGREADLEEALLLTKYFYPHINRELLYIGKDIGMLDSIEIFKAWCPLEEPSHVSSNDLPKDF